jgi:hypothetical protein
MHRLHLMNLLFNIQYQKSFEIGEKIGDIPGLALSMGQMGNLYLQKK